MNAGDSMAFDREALRAGAKQTSLPWMKAVLDPFHDSDLDIGGAPDPANGDSVVYTVRRNLTLKAPVGLTDGSNWDAHIAFVPYMQDDWSPGQINYRGRRVSERLGETSCPLVENSFLQAQTGPSGSDLFRPSTLAHSECHGTDISEYFEFSNGKARIIAGGFQVHNVTAEMYKQGDVVCYEAMTSPDVTPVDMAYAHDGENVNGSRLANIVQLPPKNLEQARALSSTQWEAAEGNYTVLKIDHEHNPPCERTSRNIVAQAAEPEETFSLCYLPANFVTDFATPYSAAGITPAGVIAPFKTTGAYYTGLSYETVLAVSIVFQVEMFPYPASPLVALSSPSCPADARALELVDEMQRDQLAAVMVKYNSAGTFFKGVLGKLRKLAQHAAPIVRAAGAIDPRIARVSKALDRGLATEAKIREAMAPKSERKRKKRTGKGKQQ